MRFAVIVVAVALVLVGCGSDKAQEQRDASLRTRASTFARAEQSAPVPLTANFPIRKALVKFTERQDLLEHPWYIYVMGENANVVGYYVGQTYPINACNFLSSTEDVESTNKGAVVVTAPSLDGIFYGGGGASAGCDAWFFFDSATDAMIVIRGQAFHVSDQPLRLEAEPITVTQP